MAKRRKRIDVMAPSMPSPPSPTEQRKWAAESLARTVVETMPGRKKMLDHITDAVMAAATKAEKSARRAK